MQQQDITSRWVAHRGDRAGGEENSLAAFQYAVKAGAQRLECDIQFTKGLIPIVLHDARLKRMYGHPAHCMDVNYDELKKYCLPKSPLLLDDFLDWFKKQTKVRLFLEVKPSILAHCSALLIARQLVLHLPCAENSRIDLISQSAVLLEALARIMPDYALGWVASKHRQPQCKLDYIFLPYQNMQQGFGLQAEGVKLAVYTVNDIQLIQHLLRSGADFIETDQYAAMVAALNHDDSDHP